MYQENCIKMLNFPVQRPQVFVQILVRTKSKERDRNLLKGRRS